MKNGNTIFFSIVIYPILPILFLLIGWWVSLPLIPEQYVYIPALVGLFVGILIDILFVRKQEQNFYKSRKSILVGIVIFYHVGIFGFFMGIPVFNIIPGLLAAIYCAKRKDFISKKQLQIFNAVFLSLICSFSAYLALSDPTTAANIEGMLNLQFHLTNTYIWGIIIVGGIFLLVLQFLISSMILYKYGIRGKKRIN